MVSGELSTEAITPPRSRTRERSELPASLVTAFFIAALVGLGVWRIEFVWRELTDSHRLTNQEEVSIWFSAGIVFGGVLISWWASWHRKVALAVAAVLGSAAINLVVYLVFFDAVDAGWIGATFFMVPALLFAVAVAGAALRRPGVFLTGIGLQVAYAAFVLFVLVINDHERVVFVALALAVDIALLVWSVAVIGRHRWNSASPR